MGVGVSHDLGLGLDQDRIVKFGNSAWTGREELGASV